MTTEAPATTPRPTTPPQRQAAPPRYVVLSKWVGWAGGWGSETDIADIMNSMYAQGYILVDTKDRKAWWNGWFPRHKLLMIFRFSPPQPRA